MTTLHFWKRLARKAFGNIPPVIDPAGVKSVVILNRRYAVGDAIASTLAMKAIRERFPKAHITVIAPKMVQTVCPTGTLYDEFWDWKAVAVKKLYYPRLLAAINHKKPDLVVNLHVTSDGIAFLGWATGGTYYTGFGPPNLRFVYTHHPTERIKGRQHEYSKIRSVLTSIGIEGADQYNPIVYYSQQDVDFVRSALGNLQVGITRGPNQKQDTEAANNGYLLISPTASSPTKAWPSAYFVTIAQRMAAQWPNLKVLVTWGPNEHEVATHFVKAVDRPTVVLAPGVSVNQLAVLTEGAQLLVCNNSGIMNMAMATATPQVVASCTHPDDWGALGPVDETLYPTNLTPEEHHKLDWSGDEQFRMQMMHRITVDEVWEAILRVAVKTGIGQI